MDGTWHLIGVCGQCWLLDRTAARKPAHWHYLRYLKMIAILVPLRHCGLNMAFDGRYKDTRTHEIKKIRNIDHGDALRNCFNSL